MRRKAINSAKIMVRASINPGLETLPVLYHGTKIRRARSILVNGFKKSKAPKYVGTGSCLTECMTIAYEFGAYEYGGRILEVTLDPVSKTYSYPGCAPRNLDTIFLADNIDAIETFGGNVWVLWNPLAVTIVKELSHDEALGLLINEFKADGDKCGYNGIVEDYSNLYWHATLERCGVSADSEYIQKLRKTAFDCKECSSEFIKW